MKNGQKSKTVCIIGFSNNIHFWRWADFLNKAGFNVSVISFIKNNFYPEYKKNIREYHDLSGKGRNRIKRRFFVFINLFRAIKIINKSKFDFINFHFIETYQYFLSLFINKKIILTCWGSDILIKYQNSKFINKFFYDNLFKKAYRITADSDPVKAAIINRCKNIDKDKINIIYWGIDKKLFSKAQKAEKNKIRKKFNLPQESIVILSIRNLTKLYRIKEIIIRFNKNFKNNKFYLFIRVSPNSDKKYIDECKLLSAGNKQILFNEKNYNYKNINEFYKLSDISWHYPDSDAAPVSMLEAVSAGHLICASPEIASYKILAQDYENIKLAHLADLNTELLKNLLKKKKAVTLKYQHTNQAAVKNLINMMH